MRRVRWFPNSQAQNHDIRSGDPGGAFKGCSSYADFRELLDKEKDVDAVKITMPVTLCGRHGHRLRTGMAKSFRVRQLKPDDPPQLIRLGLMDPRHPSTIVSTRMWPSTNGQTQLSRTWTTTN